MSPVRGETNRAAINALVSAVHDWANGAPIDEIESELEAALRPALGAGTFSTGGAADFDEQYRRTTLQRGLEHVLSRLSAGASVDEAVAAVEAIIVMAKERVAVQEPSDRVATFRPEVPNVGQRGRPKTYRVASTPPGYSGPGLVDEVFGAGSNNADQTAFATRIEPERFPRYVEERRRNGGRVSASNALRALGWGIIEIDA